MPTYQFRNKETGEITEKFMSLKAREQYLQDNPQLETVIGAVAMVGDSSRMKPDNGFRDVLKEIKSKHDHHRQLTRTTINTF